MHRSQGASGTPRRPAPGVGAAHRGRASLVDGVHEVGPARLAHFGLDGPVIAEGVAELQGVQLLGEADAVAHVQSRREISAEHQRGLVGDVGLEAHVLDADARAEVLAEDRGALRERRAARPAPRPADAARAAVAGGAGLRRLERAAGEDQRHDLRLGQRRIGEERHVRLQQGAAHVDARGDVGELLDGAYVDPRVIDRTAGEDEAPELDVELAPVGGVLALGHRELAGAAGDGVVAALDGEAAGEPAGEARGIDVHLVTEDERDGAHRFEALGGIFHFAADDHLIGRGAHGVGQVPRLDLRERHGHLPAHLDAAPGDAEVEIGGGVDLRLGNVRDAQICTLEVKFPVRQELAPFEAPVGRDAAGAGSVTAHGRFEWRELLPYGRFHLEGTNLRVADIPEAQIDASPDLDFSVAGRRIEVSGKVTVPFAKIQPRNLADAVRASPDEVIVGSEVEDPAKRFEAMSAVTLVLGDKVNIDTSGLTGRLTGSLTIKSGYDPITRGTGELSVTEGKYTAYGRKLDIQLGRLIFTGGPIDDPGIDVRAVKQFPDVTAGVNVRGTLLQPHMTFFSDPPLPQSQVVSLILAGGSLESAQTRTTGNSGAGTAALAQGGAILAQQLGSHVGIEDVSLESDITN